MGMSLFYPVLILQMIGPKHLYLLAIFDMLSSMTISKRILILSIIILTASQLAACGVATPMPTVAETTRPSFTPAIPTATVSLFTPSSTSTQTSSLPVSPAPDGLRMAYVIDGNLFFQDSSDPPLQLTYSGEDWRLVFFSDDGQKVFFFRGVNGQDLYSINVDGS